MLVFLIAVVQVGVDHEHLDGDGGHRGGVALVVNLALVDCIFLKFIHKTG